MASLQPPPVGTSAGTPAGTSSSTSSNGSFNTPLDTPSERSDADGDAPSVNWNRPVAGSLRLQTDFGPEQHRSSEDDESKDDGYDTPDDFPRETRPKYTAIEEQQVVKKFDRKLVPFLAFLYLLSFLDRSNIGNAKIAGLTDDLHLSSAQYEWVLTAFYITYILFEWMTLMYRLVPAHIYVALCVFGWGLVASLQSIATSFGALVFLRAALGIAEAAFGPGVPFYLSLFYRREELAFRNGLFISAAPLASSFASTLAWLIVRLSRHGPISPWRTLFLVEGFPSVIVAVVAWMVIPDAPGSAWFLSPRQRQVAQLRMEASSTKSGYYGQAREKKINWKEVGKTLADPKSYIAAFMFFSCNVAFSSMPVFLPTIIADMGYSSLSAQALSAPPYLVAFASVLFTAYISDRRRKRSPYLILHALISSTSYLLIALTSHFHAHLPVPAHRLIRYICVYPAVAGFFSAITLIMTWTMDNRPATEGKGAAMAVLNLIGQCGPLLGTRLYPASDGPWYVRGMATCAFFMLLVAALAVVLRLLLQQEDDVIELEGGESEVLIGGGQVEAAPGEKFTYIL
ncbi:putative MFS transporter [Aspergillus candidus]|uniref:Permease of the major facilitator superfamily n=1 Tax=Aspergillus candidus TaxID=41067 RepID=A0A2I2F0X2_ASPCN|nr:permease of the major facilitator superfamily [Aspergillus candidus]PLB34281.1 permease of the major facilitator superfamily [Aspergillus candidus]